VKAAEIERLLADQGKPGVKDWITNSDVRIGCQFTAATGGVTQRSYQVARVQVGKLSARSWRVTLGALTFAASAVDPVIGAPPIIARVTFGFDGAAFMAEVDWPANGGHFEVWADNINVDLVIGDNWQTDPALPTSDPQTAVLGTATIQPAASVGGPRATRSVYTGTIFPGAVSPTIAVPPFAKAVRWHQILNQDLITFLPQAFVIYGSQEPAFAYLTQNSPQGFTTSERTWPSDDGLTLHPLTRFLQVQNTSNIGGGAGNFFSLQLEFVLDLS
jgi:hypothetical protein